MSELAVASPLTSYFKSVSASKHLATAFQQRKPGQKIVKRPMGRPRKRSAIDESPAETTSDAVVVPYYTREPEYKYFDRRHHFRLHLHVAQHTVQALPQSRRPLTFNVIFPVPITGALWHCNYYFGGTYIRNYTV